MRPFVDRSWVVLAATSLMMCIAMALPIYGGSVANTYMSVALGWKRQTLGLLIAVNMVANAAAAPVAAVAVGKIGVRKSMLIGSAILAVAGVVLANFVDQPWQAIVAFSVLVGVAGGLAGIIPCQVCVAAWFEQRRTLALSIIYAAQGLGGYAAAFLINQAIASTGDWRSGWWVFAVGGVLGLAIAFLLVKDHPEGASAKGPSPGGPIAHGVLPDGQTTLGRALRSPLLWGIYLTMFSVMAGSGFLLAHAQVYLRGVGFSPTVAASAISLLPLAMVAGNLGFGALTPRLGLMTTYLLAIAIFSSGLLILLRVRSDAELWAFAAVTGVGYGAGQVGAMAMLGHYWSTRLFPALTATGLMLQTVVGGTAPILAGAYFDAHHNYQPVIWVLAIANLGVAGVLAAISGRRLGRSRPAAGAGGQCAPTPQSSQRVEP